jgi:hypothetical protein
MMCKNVVSTSVTAISRSLVLFTETMTVYFENHTKHVSSRFGGITESS